MTDVLREIQRIVARPVGRGTEAFLAYTEGHLGRAAAALLRPSTVVIVTGFYIAGAQPPAAETDGPIGAVQLAAALGELGGRVRLLTDGPCAPVVRGAIDAAGLAVPLDIDRYSPSAAIIAVERPGPCASGVPRTMRGEDMSAYTAPLHGYFERPGAYRVGIGDGGNELGMGCLPPSCLDGVPLGAEIHCTVGADALIVGGTSNWAAAGLVAALAVLSGHPALPGLLAPAWSRRVLTALVEEHGAVDGVLGRREVSVDGLAWPEYAGPLEELAALVSGRG